jgi:hypothetical protein
MTTIRRCAIVIAAIVLAAAVAGADDSSRGGSARKRAPRRVQGTVKSVDPATGEVSITVPGSDDEITIRLPPSELSGFARGDHVDLTMDLAESPAARERPAETK